MPALRTVLVRRKDGHECLINATDFDPKLHELVGTSAPKPAEEEKPPAPEAPAKTGRGKK